LMDLLMERLDRLGPAKWLAQVASVLGHRCDVALLQAMALLDDTTFARELRVVRDAGLMAAEGKPDEFAFKHALVADTAYASLPLRLRASLHGRVADHLLGLLNGQGAQAGQGGQSVERVPGVLGDEGAPGTQSAQGGSSGMWASLAHHLTQAGRRLEAARAWLQAAQAVLGHGAPREAESHLRAGVAALQAEPESRAKDLAMLALLSVLGPTTMVLMGPGAAPFGEIQQQAHALCLRLAHEPGVLAQQFPITYGLSLYHWGRAELDTAAGLARALREHAGQYPRPETRMAACNMSGMVAFHQGRAPKAREYLHQSVSEYEPERDQSLYPVYLMDFGVFGRFYLALASFVSGEAEQARALAGQAFTLAEQLAQPHSLGFAMLANMNTACMAQDVAEARQWAERCMAYSSEMGFPEFVAMARVVRGWALSRQGEPEAGLHDMREGTAQWCATGFGNWQTWFATLTVEALWELGRLDEALALVDEHLQRVAQTGEAQFQSLLQADRAHLLRQLGDEAQARRALDAALTLASQQGAPAWMARIQALSEARAGL
jgi:tetratricopeptide (TPR) repeat protein